MKDNPTGRVEGSGLGILPIPPSREAFSYVRIGDGEVQFLLEARQGGARRIDADLPLGGPSAFYSRGARGLPPQHYERFRQCLQRASLVDLCAGVSAFQERHLDEAIEGISFRETIRDGEGNLILSWTCQELGRTCTDRKVMIVGAEGDLLAALSPTDAFQKTWLQHYKVPLGQLKSFTLPRFGLDLDLHLEETKEYVANLLQRHSPDLLLLSAGTAGKILVVELADEFSIPVLDFGACLRGLTYSGSPGYRAVRMDYIPFFWKLPIQSVMEAWESARPEMPREELFVRTLCQVMLAGVGKTVGKMCPLESYDRGWLDLSPEAKAEFREGWDYVRQRFGSSRSRSPLMKEEWARFESWATWTGIRPHARWHQQVDRVGRKIRLFLHADRAA